MKLDNKSGQRIRAARNMRDHKWTQDELIAKVNAAGAARIDRTTLLPVAFTALGATEVAQCTGVTVNFKGYKDE